MKLITTPPDLHCEELYDRKLKNIFISATMCFIIQVYV